MFLGCSFASSFHLLRQLFLRPLFGAIVKARFDPSCWTDNSLSYRTFDTLSAPDIFVGWDSVDSIRFYKFCLNRLFFVLQIELRGLRGHIYEMLSVGVLHRVKANSCIIVDIAFHAD